MLRNTVLLTLLLVGGAAERVLAQDSARGQSTVVEKPAAAGVTAGQDGFAIQSSNGEFRLQIGLLVHADGRFAAADIDEQIVDTFAFRRVRPYLRGRFSRRFEFYFDPDFAGGTLVVQDAYVDTVFAPAFRLRAGKGKTPFGMERLHPARTSCSSIARCRPRSCRIAISAFRCWATSPEVSSAICAGVMNGVPDGGSADLDTNDGKDLSGRLVVRPFTKLAQGPLEGLGLAFSGSNGRQIGASALPTFRTQIARTAVFLL